MFNGISIKMRKKNKTISFWLFNDGTYRILSGNGWSKNYEDFADKYIKLRDAGFVEVIS